jgi:hypothetical protein
MDAAFFWLSIFMGSQAALIGLGCLPLSLWRSFSSRSGGGSENEGKPPQMPPDESPRQPEPT